MKYTRITIENEEQKVTVEEKEKGMELPATEIASLFYHAMIALSYHPDTAKDMFSDRVDV